MWLTIPKPSVFAHAHVSGCICGDFLHTEGKSGFSLKKQIVRTECVFPELQNELYKCSVTTAAADVTSGEICMDLCVYTFVCVCVCV